jgi:hypothetical protein
MRMAQASHEPILSIGAFSVDDDPATRIVEDVLSLFKPHSVLSAVASVFLLIHTNRSIPVMLSR